MAQISSQASPRPQMNVPGSGVGTVACTFLVSAGFGPRSVAAVYEAGKRCVSHVAVRPSPIPLPRSTTLCTAQGPEPTSAPVAPSMPVASGAQPIETISAPAPAAPKSRKRGLGGLFGRKRKNEQDSMSDWLGVEDDYDARSPVAVSVRGITLRTITMAGRAAPSSDGASSEDMLSAVASMGDDELLGHDIWFVATGASDCDGAGMKTFLASHRDKLRGVFLHQS